MSSLPWRLKPVTNDGRELLIAGIAGHEFVELEQREGGNHGFPAPASFHFHAIKAFDKEDVLSRCALKAHRGNGQADFGGQTHGDVLGFDDAVEIVLR